MRVLSFCLAILSSTLIYAQEWRTDHIGAQVGLSVNFGTHVRQFGIRLQAYGTYEFTQLNVGHQIHFNFHHLADRKKYISNRSSLGLVILGGKRTSIPNFIFDGLNHQTEYDHGIAYNYVWYYDNAGSSQRSGGFGLHFQELSVHIENDLFSGTGRDRFRTSYFSIHYHTGEFNLNINTQLWTGETWGTKLKNTRDSMYQVGYKDLRNTLYGNKSHGVFSVGIDYLLGYGNRIHGAIGVDHERIRHGLQNKFMHDKPFIPSRWRDPNVNYPMLDDEGNPVHRKGKERPGRFFIQFGLNRGLTY